MFKITVPATSANLGSGVDCLGMALSLYLTVSVKKAENNKFIFARGFEKPVPDKDNLILTGMRKVEALAGKALPPTEVTVETEVPLSRGLGSSASAIVAGAFAANELLGHPFDTDGLFNICAGIEGHPDNIAPSVYGGFTVALSTGGDNFSALKIAAPELAAVIAIPDVTLPTSEARRVLPKSVSLGEAIHQVQRVSLMTAALCRGRFEYLSDGAEDVLFTPARRGLIPAFDQLCSAARDAGAHCAMISGAGPSVLALTDGDGESVRRAMEGAYEKCGISGRVLCLKPENSGVRIEHSEA